MPAFERRGKVRGNSRSHGSLLSMTLKVDPTRWKFCESCETTAAGGSGSKHVLLPAFSRCHDLTNTLCQFRVELTSKNQSASLKRRLPACLPAIRPVPLRDPSPLFVLYSCVYMYDRYVKEIVHLLHRRSAEREH